ncbi:MAG: SOS response-associated peptidase [Hyphomicrobiaceae bacterium]
MCNLYSMTTNHEAILRLFKVSHNRASPIEPQAAIFPGGQAPVVRRADDGERELLALSWGFVLLLKGKAPKRVTNFRDDKINSSFWSASLRERRCLVPVSSFSEPKGRQPAIWHWFALSDAREPFAFAGIWRQYKGPIRKDGEAVEIETFSFMTTRPNALVATVHPTRMPVMLVGAAAHDQWLEGSREEALELVRSYPADAMKIVQADTEKKDLL